MNNHSRYYNGPSGDHFDGHRFFGPDHAAAKTLGDMLRWSFTGQRARWPRYVANPPADKPQRITGSDLRITMIGHASVLLQGGGLNILVDPVWSQRASPIAFMGPKRVRAPGIALADLPPIDLVLVTHNHYDHLDLSTLKKLVRQFNPLIVTPLGNDTLIRKSIPPARLQAIDWDQASEPLPGLIVTAEPTQHWSSRRLTDRNEALWGAFTLSLAGRRLFITGDSGYGAGAMAGWWAKRVQARHGSFDLAILPIGAYAPRWFMRDAHMDPAEAVAAMGLLGARQALGYHYGTFQLTDESMNEPVEKLALALADAGIDPNIFRTLEPGQYWLIT